MCQHCYAGAVVQEFLIHRQLQLRGTVPPEVQSAHFQNQKFGHLHGYQVKVTVIKLPALTIDCSSTSMKYSVYYVDSLSMSKGQNHRAIYVETNPENEEGKVYHVVGAKISMKYESESRKPKDEVTFLKMEKVGEMESSMLEKLEDVCSSISPPRSPIKLPKGVQRPACNDWVSNACFRLNQAGVVQFLPGVVPEKEVKLHIEKGEEDIA